MEKNISSTTLISMKRESDEGSSDGSKGGRGLTRPGAKGRAEQNIPRRLAKRRGEVFPDYKEPVYRAKRLMD